MAETVNVSEAAVKISKDIFNVFKWKVSGNFDINLSCTIPEHNLKTHPCDCVFYYIDPYTSKYVFLNTDLKSYARKSITKNTMSNAVKSLAKAIHCADFSEEWNSKYLIPTDGRGYEIRGFLFVYNHDNEFKDELASLISKFEYPQLKKNQKIHIFSPELVNLSYSIAVDFRLEKEYKEIEKYSFWYPDMILHKVSHGSEWEHPASIEMLSGSMVTIKYQTIREGIGYILYYKRDGDTVDEFLYLIDLLSHYQILSQNVSVEIKVVSKTKSKNIKNNLQNAKISYMQAWSLDEGREKQLDLISVSSVTLIHEDYNFDDLGWRENDV